MNSKFSAINIVGLSLGMACSLLILLWVVDEWNRDVPPANAERLYKVVLRTNSNGKIYGGYGTQGLLAGEIRRKVPDVEATSSYGYTQSQTFAAGDKILKLPANYAGADYFRMLGYPLLEGRAGEALSGPLSLAISRKMAVEFFGGTAAAIGKTVRVDNQKDLTVSAVFEDLPANATDHFECLMNWDAFLAERDWLQRWGNTYPSTYVLLRPGANLANVERQLTHFLDAYQKPTPDFERELGLQLVRNQYLYSRFDNGVPSGGRIEYVRLFSVVAAFILLIACINFMNLSTARSSRRAKEIGVRKVLGAERRSLVFQFIGESLVMAGMAGVLALLMVALALPAFNGLTGKAMHLPWQSFYFWLTAGGLIVVTGGLSGSYPALFLSGFQPIRVLKGILPSGVGTGWLRKGLVVFQFTLSIMLILGTFLISQQINYVLHKNLGYDRENLLYVQLEGELPAKYNVFKAAALNMPGVGAVSELSDPFTNLESDSRDLDWVGKAPGTSVPIAVQTVGLDLVKTMRLQMAMGRDFSADFPSDSNAFILNEAAVAKIGFKDPIGKTLSFWGKKGPIVGVMKDFHFQSLHEAIRPIILRRDAAEAYSVAVIRTQPGKTAEVLAGMEKLCKQLNPKFPFTYQFPDEEYAKLYRSEQTTGRLGVLFALLAVVISCLGLLGLSMFASEQRMKEVGIRKVLGAKLGSLFVLLSRELLLLVGVAFLIAAPLGRWMMQYWRDQFAYKAPVPLWVFVATGLLVLLVSLLTIGWQVARVVRANPAGVLRSE
jgi:predicted permease